MKNQLKILTLIIFFNPFFGFGQINLDVEGNAIIRHNQPQLSLFDETESRTEGIYRNVGDGIQFLSPWGDQEFWTGSSGLISPRMIIEGSSGHVGIGQTDPVSFLHLGQGPDVSLTAHGSLTIGNINATNISFDDNEIQSRNNNSAERLLLQVHGGNVGIGSLDPQSKLHIEGGNEASLFSDGFFMMGSESSTNLIMDNNEIQARINDTGSNLFVQPHGGDLLVDGNSLVVASSDNQVGIGTSSPDAKLEVRSVSSAGNPQLLLNEASSGSPRMYFKSQPASARYAYITSNPGSFTGASMGLGYNDGTSSRRFIDLQFADDYVEIQRNSGDILLCSNSGAGAVGIGVSDVANLPAGYELAVDGKIIAEEIRVEMSGSWPDYVFDPSYHLKSIPELHEEIKRLGHLPGIPSASTVEEEGIQLGEMQTKMMEKIEELTLYIIQLESRINTLENETK